MKRREAPILTKGRASWMILLAFLFWLLLLSNIGCSTCSTKCCETCPPEIKTITKWRQTPAPELPRTPAPELTSAWSEEEADANPDGWLEALLTDLMNALNSFDQCDETIRDSNETRPPS